MGFWELIYLLSSLLLVNMINWAVCSGRLKGGGGVLGADTARKRGVLGAGPIRKKGVLGAGQVKKGGVFTAAHTYTEHICE